MAALARIVPIESRRRPLTESERLRAELDVARGQIDQLTSTVADQAKALAAVTDECPPWAPSLAIVYWLWSQARGGDRAWRRMIWVRITRLIDELGDLPAPLMTPSRWDEHRARRRTQPTKFGRPPCEQVINIELIYAKQMLSWAVARGLIKRNPLAAARRVRALSQRETWLGPADVDRLLVAADDVTDGRRADGEDDGQRTAMLKAFMLCCFDSMLRFNEARHLRLDRIGADGGVELLASETKSKRRRFVQLTPRTMAAIARIERPGGTSYIFARDAARLICETTIRAWFRRACEISGVDERATLRDKRVRLHDLRAGGATTADELGARPTAIRDALGHSSLEMTERYLRSDRRENARTVAAVLSHLAAEARPRSRRRVRGAA